MRNFDFNVLNGGRYLIAGILVWLGLLGILGEGGFTTISTIPFIGFGDPRLLIYVAQLVIAGGLFIPSLNIVAKVAAVLYFALVVYAFITTLDIRFDPTFPNLSDKGLLSLLEAALTVGVYAYLTRFD